MQIQGTGPYTGSPGYDRGMQSTMYCGNDPESWVRGSATLDTDSGVLSMTIQLETDSTTAGPKGQVTATLLDANGSQITSAVSDEVGMGGKPPGGAVIENFTSSVSISPDQAAQAQSLYVEASCTGSSFEVWGVNPDDVEHAFDIAIGIIEAAG